MLNISKISTMLNQVIARQNEIEEHMGVNKDSDMMMLLKDIKTEFDLREDNSDYFASEMRDIRVSLENYIYDIETYLEEMKDDIASRLEETEEEIDEL